MQTNFSPHPDDEALEQYAMGRLPDTQTEALEEHLLVCHVCQDRMEETEAFITAAKGAAAKLRARPPSVWDRFRPAILAVRVLPRPVLAAGLAGVALAVLWIARPWESAPWSTPPVTVYLQATRGIAAGPVAKASAWKPFVLTADPDGLPPHDSYRLEVVDEGGLRVWESTVRPVTGRLSVRSALRLAGGHYWVRLYSPAPDGALLREYGLQVE